MTLSFEQYTYAVATQGVSILAEQEAAWSYVPGREDGPADAYRHILLAAELTRQFGETYANTLLNSHEFTGNHNLSDPQTPEANAMDSHNNQLGIEIGKRLAEDPNATWEDVIHEARNLFDPNSNNGDGARWLDDWSGNPKDDNGDAIPNGDPRLNWPAQWGDKPFYDYPSSLFDKWFKDGVKGLFDLIGGIADAIGDLYNMAQDWVGGGGDPLVLDLDGDGIETSSVTDSHKVLFDTNGDGLKTATGWVNADDALLVMDRNGNGTIDNGGELFGDQTIVNGVKATDGFSALRTEDTNNNGRFDANDTNFTNVRIWQDNNQDGISQSSELKTLIEAGISSINLSAEENIVANNTNTQTHNGMYTKTDGSTGAVANLVFTQESFYRTFTDSIPLADAAKGLPQMQGSGMVRDLREAMSMQTDEGIALADILTQYASLTTRDEQMAMIDTLVLAWGNTSGFDDLSIRAQEQGYIFSTNLSSSEQIQLLALEQFNGRGYWRMPWDDIGAKGARLEAGIWDDETGNKYVSVWKSGTWPVIDAAYVTLKDSVYAGLVLQTRLEPYLNAIDFTFDNNGLTFNFDAMDAKLMALQSRDARNALIDTLELLYYAGNTLIQSGWEGSVLLSDMLHNAEGLIDTQALLNELNMGGVDNTPWLTTGRTIVGSFAGDMIQGSYSGNQLIGLDGNDTLRVFEGNNMLIGGEGDDMLIGGIGDDKYIFSKGDGADTICEDMTNSIDTLVFTNSVNPNEVRIWRDQTNMYFGINGTDDVVTVSNHYGSYDSGIDQVLFSDGTVWNGGIFNAAKFVGTHQIDSIYGTLEDNAIQGLGGNDDLYGEDGSDTYLFNLGDGQDTIIDYSTNVDNKDTLQFGTEITASNTTMWRDDYNLYFSLNNTTDKITVSGHFNMSENQIEQVKFTDGTIWDSTVLNSAKFVGTDGDDAFNGGDGNDVLVGGAGSDSLSGGAGDDTIFSDMSTFTGAGSLMIDGGLGIDTLVLTANTYPIFDFTLINSSSTNIDNIEMIDLGNNGNHSWINLSLYDVLDMTDSNRILTIMGDLSDGVDFSDEEGWSKSEISTETINGSTHTFDYYHNSNDPTVLVKVEQAIVDTI